MVNSVEYYSQGEVSPGSVFSRSFDVIRQNPVTVPGLVILFYALPQVLFQQALPTGNSLALLQQHAPAFFGFSLFSMAALLIFSGALIQAAIMHGQGRRAAMGEMLRVGLVRALPLWAVSILLTIGTVFGILLLIIPGVIIAVMWSMAVPAIVAERPGLFGAFGRSLALTKGARWRVFGILLLAGLIYAVVLSVISAVAFNSQDVMVAIASGKEPVPQSLFAQIIYAVVAAIAYGWLTILIAALFIELRHWKEGPDVDQLADVFA